ncbi:hypothetical protein CYMTET_10163 [Cymbomonas tetramitiformis]|uniref:Uncharacterized protein n=1 Tax=Cymbomonas tetramitiformis TaxID=36881 RepID=A0AAE0GQA4_9CHLO|nr:hypothetical protein CYMTET_10163 [Cymbomonas tetramitiformis]
MLPRAYSSEVKTYAFSGEPSAYDTQDITSVERFSVLFFILIGFFLIWFLKSNSVQIAQTRDKIVSEIQRLNEVPLTEDNYNKLM